MSKPAEMIPMSPTLTSSRSALLAAATGDGESPADPPDAAALVELGEVDLAAARALELALACVATTAGILRVLELNNALAELNAPEYADSIADSCEF